MPYRNANPDASPFVLVLMLDGERIPAAMPKDITAGDVLLAALAHAEAGQGPVEVYNDGFHVCTVSIPE